MKILMVLTSHDQLGNTGRKTGHCGHVSVNQRTGVQVFSDLALAPPLPMS
jgi:hypothetical protein